MKKTKYIMIVLILVLTSFLTSCTQMDNNSANNPFGIFLSINPSDNSQNIGVNSAIVLQFAAPVDTKVIESNFVLISQKDISDSSCPVSKNMGHSDMNKAMMDTSMMSHLKNNHCTKGTFKWSSDKKTCEFKSESNLEPNMEYMLYVDPDMVNHMKDVMLTNGMMNTGMGMMKCDCMNKGLDNKNIISHFKTSN